MHHPEKRQFSLNAYKTKCVLVVLRSLPPIRFRSEYNGVIWGFTTPYGRKFEVNCFSRFTVTLLTDIRNTMHTYIRTYKVVIKLAGPLSCLNDKTYRYRQAMY